MNLHNLPKSITESSWASLIDIAGELERPNLLYPLYIFRWGRQLCLAVLLCSISQNFHTQKILYFVSDTEMISADKILIRVRTLFPP